MMRVVVKFVFVMVLLCNILTTVKAQTYTLLDRRWYKPAILSDTVTRENLSDGWFPIYTKDIDSLIILVSKFRNLKNDGFDRKFYYADDFKTEYLKFTIDNIKRSYGDGYEINLISTTSIGSNTLKLSDPAVKLPQNQMIIRAFIDYLKLTKKNIDNPKKKRKGGNNPLTG